LSRNVGAKFPFYAAKHPKTAQITPIFYLKSGKLTMERNNKYVHSLAISANNWLKQRKKQYFFLSANDWLRRHSRRLGRKGQFIIVKERMNVTLTSGMPYATAIRIVRFVNKLIFPPQAGYGVARDNDIRTGAH
jgi:hypothetical protein